MQRPFRFALTSLLVLSVLSHVHAKRPNVLLIYGDDQGSVDLGCFGSRDLQTPCLDRLAAGGVTMTQMYSAAPVCSASRVGLLTGRYPARAGQPGNGDLESAETTIAESFQAAGYRTGHVGKWHLGKSDSQRPSGQGFESWFGHLGGCIDNYSHFFYWNGPNRHDLFDNGVEVHLPGQFFPDLMVDRCRKFMGNNQSEEPWLLYWAFNAPHYPYQGTPEWLEAYRELPSPRREYCAFVSTMDQKIGEVLDHLQATGQAKNTIVIYQPDHGHSTETRAFGGGGDAGPYRGAKFSLFEGGIRVPAIVRYPGELPAGVACHQMLTACDWFPTLAEYCGVPAPRNDQGNLIKLDGISVTKVLSKNEPLSREPFYWQFGRGDKAQWAVREGKWKLIANPRDTSASQTDQINGGRLKSDWFLVDLEKDPGEQTNLAEANPETKSRLIKLGQEIQAEF